MAISRSQKEEIVAGLIDSFKRAKTVVFADCKGLTVAEFEDLRDQFRKNNIGCKIAKKNLINLAAKQAGIESLDIKPFEGSIAAIFSYEDEIEAARIAHNFGKTHEVFSIRGGIAEGAVHDERYIITLAQLPTKEELLGKLVRTLNGPISGFHGVLHGVIRGFAQVVKAIADKQQA